MPQPNQEISGRALLDRARAAIASSQAITQAVKAAAAQLPPRPAVPPPGGPRGSGG